MKSYEILHSIKQRRDLSKNKKQDNNNSDIDFLFSNKRKKKRE